MTPMLMLIFARHLVWSRSDGRGGTTTLYYDDEVTWLLAAVALILIVWLLLRAYRHARAFRRPPPRIDRKSLRRIAKIKRELSRRYLRSGFSKRIHAVGIGVLETGGYCIQFFINDADEELWTGAGAEGLPNSYRGVPVITVEMRVAIFLSTEAVTATHGYSNGIRERREVIVGGLSGANTNLAGQSGTIGYFCTRRSKWRRRKEILLLSNSHVFADLQKASIDAQDLIMQPSPGEPGSHRPIGALVDYSALEFDDDQKENHVDAAIARLWSPHPHDALIPFIGAVRGWVQKRDLELGERVRKFGRTTGYSEGRVFSICLDIWIQYDRTGRAAFFADQILIEPAAPAFSKFVHRGDSGSLLVDAAQNAVGLIFAGMSDAPADPQTQAALPGPDQGLDHPKRVEGYGVANPIGEVLDRMKIDLVIRSD